MLHRMTPEEAMHRCQQLMSHAWMVRTFIKHSPEVEDFPELMGIVRSVFDLSRALETQLENPEKYLLMLRRKLSKLKASVKQFAEDAARISDHTNFKMAVDSIRIVTSDLEAILKACPVGPQAPPPVKLPGRPAPPATVGPAPHPAPIGSASTRQVFDVDWLLRPEPDPQSSAGHPRFPWSCMEACRITVEQGIIVDLQPQPKGAPRNGRVIVPPLVNAHTHLEFSALEEPYPATNGFADWIRTVVRSRQIPATVSPPAAILQGLSESVQQGVKILGDIATEGWIELLQASRPTPSSPVTETVADLSPYEDLRLVLFAEILGFSTERQQQLLDRAKGLLAALQQRKNARWSFGLSPHAPYTVPLDLLEKVVDLSREYDDVPVAMHLAESREELELLEQGTGPLASMLQDFGLWKPGLFGGRSVQDYLDRLGQASRSLIIHGNSLSLEQMDWIADRPGMSVVWCPRTHAAFQHEPYPLEELLSRDINVALGTDSRASNPDLAIWRELRLAGELHPEIDPLRLLHMATIGGSLALGVNLDETTRQPVSINVGHHAHWTLLQFSTTEWINPSTLLKANCVPE